MREVKKFYFIKSQEVGILLCHVIDLIIITDVEMTLAWT